MDKRNLHLVIRDTLYVDFQPSDGDIAGRAVLRNGSQLGKDQSAEGIAVLRGQFHIQLLLHLAQICGAAHFPVAVLPLDNVRRRGRRAVVGVGQVASQPLNQVCDRHDTRHAAVFIQYNGKLIARCAHIAEQDVCLDTLRHQVRRSYRLCHDRLPVLAVQAVVVLGIQHADDVILGLAAHGIEGKAPLVNGFVPRLHIVLNPQNRDLGTVYGDLPGGQIVKFKHILNDALLLAVNGAGFGTGIHHQADVLLACLLIRLRGVNAHQAQYAVRGFGQQPDQRGKQRTDRPKHSRYAQRQRFGLAHGNPLRHQLAENQRDVGQDQRNHYDGNRVHRGLGYVGIRALLHQRVYDGTREVVGGKGASQESRQRDSYLNGRQKLRGLFRQLQQAAGTPVPILCQLIEFVFVDTQHCNLCCGEHGVQRDEQYLQEYHQENIAFHDCMSLLPDSVSDALSLRVLFILCCLRAKYKKKPEAMSHTDRTRHLLTQKQAAVALTPLQAHITA